MIAEEDIQKLKTFRKYSSRPNMYYSEHFELQLSKVSKLWCLFHHCEVDGELDFIGVVHDVEDLKYLVEQAGKIWKD